MELLWIFGGTWVGLFLLEASDDFEATRRLLREMRRQLRWVVSLRRA